MLSVGCGRHVSGGADDDGSSGSGSSTSGVTTTPGGDGDGDGDGDGEGDGDGDGESEGGGCPEDGCLDVLDAKGCLSADECILHDDCCRCDAYYVEDDPPPECDEECDVTMCEYLGVTAATCNLDDEIWGCSPSIDCRASSAACEQAPPQCPEGELPTVIDGCWGPCLPATSCYTVDDCDACPDGFHCLPYVHIPGIIACAPIPEECPDPPTCECLGDQPCNRATETSCDEDENGAYCKAANWGG